MRKRNVTATDLELESFIELEGTVIDTQLDESTGTLHIAMVLDGTGTTISIAMPEYTRVKKVIFNG